MSSTTRKSPPPRLGRGLSALIPDAPPSAEAGTLRSLPIEALEPGPFQPRGGMDKASLDELAASIREHGILQPILARPKPGVPGTFEIIGGERRWRAAQAAQLHEVPVVIRELADREAMAAGLVENLQRSDLNAMEEAEGYRRLLDEFGLTQDALGQAVGKSRSHVANTLRLLTLPPEVRSLVGQGVLSAGHARTLVGAGTVLQAGELELLAAAGGRLAVSPHTDVELIAEARRRGLVVLPGAMTASEVFAAARAGAHAVKIFPAATLGPSHVQALRAVLPPALPLLAVGGVNVANLAEFLRAGCTGAGLGGELYRPGQAPGVTARHAAAFVAAWRAALRPRAGT